MTYSITPAPKEIEKAQRQLEGVLGTCEAVLPKDDSYEVMLAANPFFESEAFSSERFAVRFDPREEWEEEVKVMAARGYAESWFFEYTEDTFHWEQLVRLGHSLRFAEHVTSQEPEVHEKEELAENWEEMRDELDEPTEVEIELLAQYGFSLAYMLAGKILEEKEFADFPELTKTEVIDAGDQIFQ